MSALKTVEQNRAIFGLGTKLRMGIDDLRELAGDVTGGRTTSLKEITFDEANAMIVRLGGEAFPVTPQRSTPRRTLNYRKQRDGIVTLASPGALRKMDELAAERGMTPEGLERLCLRMKMGRRPRTAQGCSAVIEALKAMNRRDAEKSKTPNPKSKIGRAA